MGDFIFWTVNEIILNNYCLNVLALSNNYIYETDINSRGGGRGSVFG
jgi:hypothetical protein